MMVHECLCNLTKLIAWSDRVENSLLLKDEENVYQLLKTPIDHILPVTVLFWVEQIYTCILVLVNVVLPCAFDLVEALGALVPVHAVSVGFNGCWNLLLELKPASFSSN